MELILIKRMNICRRSWVRIEVWALPYLRIPVKLKINVRIQANILGTMRVKVLAK
ncbi:hypothetical protein D3C74_499800 [compost metagenome]